MREENVTFVTCGDFADAQEVPLLIGRVYRMDDCDCGMDVGLRMDNWETTAGIRACADPLHKMVMGIVIERMRTEDFPPEKAVSETVEELFKEHLEAAV